VTDQGRRHHYVPACYLKHFAVPQDRYAGRLYVYDRDSNRSFASSPDNSAHQRDFYRVDVEGEHPNLAENAFEALETRFAPTVAGVIERGTLPTDPMARHELYAFVATQAVRTPRVREIQSRFYNDSAMLLIRTLGENKNVFMRELRKSEPGITGEDAEEMYATHLEFLNAKGARVEMDQTTLVRDVLELAGDLEDVLARRSWILGVAPADASFITSDDPVHLQPAGAAVPKNPLWSPGFGDPHTNVIVPLNPRLVLMGLPYEFTARARVRMSRQHVAAINTDIALSAHRFVYSTTPTFAQIGPDGVPVEGPTAALRRSESPSQNALGFFSA
jgi:hypothetical protein